MNEDRIKLAAEYCKIAGEADEDLVFTLCYDAAIEYAENAGVPEPEEKSAAYDLLICMLTSTWYDNRGSMIVGQVPNKLERTVSSLVLSLR